jgi:hypothetical protein
MSKERTRKLDDLPNYGCGNGIVRIWWYRHYRSVKGPTDVLEVRLKASAYR